MKIRTILAALLAATCLLSTVVLSSCCCCLPEEGMEEMEDILNEFMTEDVVTVETNEL